MEYAILIYESEKDRAVRNENGEEQELVSAAYDAFTEALVNAGVMRGGQRLVLPDLATTISIEDGKTVVHDGPFADTKEQLGGFFIIEADNLDVALDWAARCPAACSGKVEIRPIG